MKIGLLTYHHSSSYGATLQTYATCKVLEQLGHKVTIINLALAEYSFSWKSIPVIPNRIFRKYLWKKIYPPLTQCFETSEALREAKFDFDILLVGSDQVWNPEISKDLCLSFFLDFGGEGVKRISYASSFGLARWPLNHEHLLPKIKTTLQKFNAISVRERTGQQMLKDYFGLDAKIVLDPTLLLSDYSKLMGTAKANNKLICYIMNHTPQQLNKVREFAAFMGEKPYQMASIRPFNGFKYIYPPTLPQWLRNISGAKYVVTDSFHGLVFCLIFHKQFVVITPDNGLNSRMQDLLKLVGLEDRLYNEQDNINYSLLLCNKIDYSIIDKVLDDVRIESIHFLNDALNLS